MGHLDLDFFRRSDPDQLMLRKQAVFNILRRNLLVAGDDIETDLGFGDPNGTANTHAVSYEYFRVGVTHPVMTPDVMIRY